MQDDVLLSAMALCPLMAGVEAPQIARLVSGATYRPVTLKRGQTLANAGDRCVYADVVIDGTLVARMLGASGKVVEVTHLRPGNMVAPAFVFAHDNAFPVEVVADSDVTLMRQTRQDFARWLDSDERLRWNFVALLSNTNAFLTRKIHTLSLLTVREKLAQMLLDLSRRQQSRTVTLEKSRQEIADMFGIQKFSVLRQLAAFQDEGAITIEGKQITILNPRLLTQSN